MIRFHLTGLRNKGELCSDRAFFPADIGLRIHFDYKQRRLWEDKPRQFWCVFDELTRQSSSKLGFRQLTDVFFCFVRKTGVKAHPLLEFCECILFT